MILFKISNLTVVLFGVKLSKNSWNKVEIGINIIKKVKISKLKIEIKLNKKVKISKLKIEIKLNKKVKKS